MSKRFKIAILIALPILAVGWYYFRPETAFINRNISEAAIQGTTTLSSGEFIDGAHTTKGTAEILQKDDQHYLRLSSFETSNGPDVHVYLVKGVAYDTDAIKSAGYIDLGSMKGNIGDQNYEIPTDVDLDEIGTISIWCKRFSVSFGVAELN